MNDKPMSSSPSWRTHFDTYDAFQGALNSICDKIATLQQARYPGDHPSRGAFGELLRNHGESICILAYGKTQDAVTNGRNGTGRPVENICGHFTDSVHRERFRAVCPVGDIAGSNIDPLVWHVRFTARGQFYRYVGKLSDVVDKIQNRAAKS